MAERKTVTITVNGEKLTAYADEMLLQTILRYDMKVPHFCYHPKLSIAGVCRMCAVEVEGSRKLEISCSLPVREGMVVQTNSPKVIEGQRSVMEFTLINHPLDCPICDQAGECWLQEYYMAHDRKPSYFLEDKVHKDKARPIGPRVMLDQERCILCTRCVRFCAEITETSELGIFNRGDRSVLDAAPGKQLTNDYSENVVDICPVGALTSRDFRFDGRVWFLKETDSICPGCARGCNVVLQHRDGTVRRILPRVNEEVNGHFMCDAGRDTYKWVHAAGETDGRLLRPQAFREGKVSTLAWSEAFEKLTVALRLARDEHDAEEIVALLSPRASNQSIRDFAEFLSGYFGKVALVVGDPVPRTWQADDILKVADRNPNTKGAEAVAQALAAKGKITLLDWRDLAKRLERGAVKVLCAMDQDLSSMATGLSRVGLLLCFSTHHTPTTARAHLSLPLTTFAEEDGSFTNFQGKVQDFIAAIAPCGESIPLPRILLGLRSRLGIPVDEAAPPLGRTASQPKVQTGQLGVSEGS